MKGVRIVDDDPLQLKLSVLPERRGIPGHDRHQRGGRSEPSARRSAAPTPPQAETQPRLSRPSAQLLRLLDVLPQSLRSRYFG